MEFLERSEELAELDAALAMATTGKGSVVLVSGEAGIGKTRLVAEWTASIVPPVRVAWGGCDDLVTPIILGPFRDIGRELGEPGLEQDSGTPSEMFGAMLGALDRPLQPTVVVVEDAHWADAASLDLLKYLGRRVARLRVVIVVTYRDNELGPGHPLLQVTGDLPADTCRRVPLRPLSEAAVVELARSSGHVPGEVYTLTRGNPFLVTEFLGAPGGAVPITVRDGVQARLARLSSSGGDLAQVVSVVPGRCERSVLQMLSTAWEDALDECRRRGLLEADTHSVWFRHELIRRAVEATVPKSEATRHHRRIATALAGLGADPARIVHHAERTQDADLLAIYAPQAARRARNAASHREAASHYARAVAVADRLSDEERAALLAEYTAECYYIDDQATAIGAARAALALYRMLGDRGEEGAILRWISRISWWTGNQPAAVESGLEAVEVLETLPPGPDLAMAYSNLAQIHMLAHDAGPATHWATKAIETAKAVGDAAAEAHALNNLGSALIRAGNRTGWESLRRSLSLSLDHDLDEHAARAYSNLAWTALDDRNYSLAETYLAAGIAFTADREIHGDLYYLTAERARLDFERGAWDKAEHDARWALSRPTTPGITTLPALSTLGRIQVRRGDAEAAGTLAEALELALPTEELQRIAPVAIGLAELAWLNGDHPAVCAAIEPVHALTMRAPQPWVTDEIVFWLWRGGGIAAPATDGAQPYVLQMAGDWRAAADAWQHIGCPYETACALADADEPQPLLDALKIFDRLGATPAGAILRRRLRAKGVKGIPRGPRRTTQQHPHGLTTRQVDVLALLAEGLTNAEIADRLYISAKTVDHHVSAILSKLEVGSRREAASIGRTLRPSAVT